MVALVHRHALGEVLALRWNRVDLDGKVIMVREALESTKAHGIRFKAPKSKAGRRDITLPDILVDALREHRRAVLELRMKLGAGRLPDDALLFSNLEGTPLQPSNVSSDWGDLAERIGDAGRDVPRTAAYSRLAADRQRRRHRHDQQAPRSRQAERHACDLCPHVSYGRQQGGGTLSTRPCV